MTDPFALPCHPERRLSPDDRAWRAIGVKSADDVLRQQTRCPDCKTSYTAFLRTFGTSQTVEWLRPAPFRVAAVPVDGGPLWQDDVEGAPSGLPAPDEQRPDGWDSVQRVTAVYVLTAGSDVVAEPGEVLRERKEKWNAQDRRLALVWSPRLQREVVLWHGFARLLQQE
ncbi:MAG: hypothetical protein JWM62_2944 [Frankiales bacterium]|nr:hypothetical protein [Frankiales bacterium]